MRYIIINDIIGTFIKKKHFLLVYLICLVMISFFFKSYLLGNNEIISNSILGIGFYKDANVVLKIFMLFNVLIYIYIAYYIFLKDIVNDYGNIFSRISKIKWLFSKLISIITMTIIIKLISYIIVYSIYGNSVELISYINNSIFTYLLQIIVIIGYIITTKSKIMTLFVIIFCIIIIGLLSFDFSFITSDYYNHYILLIFSIFSILNYLLIGKKKISLILERNG
ncbi:MAG: hypothetical protein RR325_01255 [Bacilli bacterium]